MKALIIVDPQKGFVDSTLKELPVTGAQEVVSIIASLQTIFANSRDCDIIITTDCHPEDHVSFIDNGGDWPSHCIEGTKGHEIIDELAANSFYTVSRKGYRKDIDAMSAFADFEGNESELNEYLKSHRVDTVFFAGYATEYCVAFNAIDAVKRGYQTFVILDAIAGVAANPNDIEAAMNNMKDAGVIFISSDSDIIPKADRVPVIPAGRHLATIGYID